MKRNPVLLITGVLLGFIFAPICSIILFVGLIAEHFVVIESNSYNGTRRTMFEKIGTWLQED